MRITEGQYLVYIHFGLKQQLQKLIGADTLLSSFRMHYYTKTK